MSNIVEVFSGIQGEGDLVGYRQIFVRFSHCQLNCAYCDTDFAPKGQVRLELSPGKRDFVYVNNPISALDLAEHILKMNDKLKHHSISLTGGEPLLHAAYLEDLITEVRDSGLEIYLETNGLLVNDLAKIINQVDIIAMDIKLESSTEEATDWSGHEEFLREIKRSIDSGNKIDLFVKVVVSNQASHKELEELAQLLNKTGHEKRSLIMQPVTPTHGILPPSPEELLELMNQAIALGLEVRVIPQTHVMLAQL